MSGGHQAYAIDHISPLAWPYIAGQQTFYFLGVPAFPPMYFYMLGVAIWSVLFFLLGTLIERLVGIGLSASAQEKQRMRAH